MRKLRYKGSMILATGILFQLAGTCLPENYFALTIRQIAVSLADVAVNSVVSDFSDQLGLTVPMDQVGNTDPNIDPNTTP